MGMKFAQDISKMRLTSELRHPRSDIFWRKDALDYKEFLKKFGLHDGRVARLKWLLAETLGCGETFEYRRQELRVLGCSAGDEDVAASFEHALRPGGVYADYLVRSQLAAVVNSTLFVHGGIDCDSLLWIPPDSLLLRADEAGDVDGRYSKDLSSWVDELNAFASRHVQEWLLDEDRGESGAAPGEALIAYQSRLATCGRSVVAAGYVRCRIPERPTRM
mmetsp:Transcript_38243/g.85767  ORF Transcript_38243/g.85767 Transcript_38243/m.85767 type:complete len:219 (-) Transcript_38243:528-1184(-)